MLYVYVCLAITLCPYPGSREHWSRMTSQSSLILLAVFFDGHRSVTLCPLISALVFVHYF